MPLKTREGVAEAPIEPGLRTLCEPWRDGAAAEVVPLDRPLEALADGDAGDLDLLAGLEGLDGDGLARGELARPADLDEPPVRADLGLGEMPELGLGELALGHLVEGELDGVVAVGLDRPHGDDGAGPRLDHRHGREHAGLLVEDLRHAELPADDALHASLSLRA